MALPDTAPIELTIYDEQTNEFDTIAVHGDDPLAAVENVFDTWAEDLLFHDVQFNDPDIDGNEFDHLLLNADDVELTDGQQPVDADTTSSEAIDTPTDPDHAYADDSADVSPADILTENATLYEAKNEDYGDSWRLVGETIALWADELDVDELDLTDPHTAILLGLYWERLIKIVRAFNLEFNDASPNNEATAESHADSSTYAAMAAALRENAESE